MAAPLNKCLTSYGKHKTLVWGEVEKKAFSSIKQAIKDLEMLFFYDESLPIFVATDACDYGIGVPK